MSERIGLVTTRLVSFVRWFSSSLLLNQTQVASPQFSKRTVSAPICSFKLVLSSVCSDPFSLKEYAYPFSINSSSSTFVCKHRNEILRCFPQNLPCNCEFNLSSTSTMTNGSKTNARGKKENCYGILYWISAARFQLSKNAEDGPT